MWPRLSGGGNKREPRSTYSSPTKHFSSQRWHISTIVISISVIIVIILIFVQVITNTMALFIHAINLRWAFKSTGIWLLFKKNSMCLKKTGWCHKYPWAPRIGGLKIGNSDNTQGSSKAEWKCFFSCWNFNFQRRRRRHTGDSMDGLTDSAKSSYGYRLGKYKHEKYESPDTVKFVKLNDSMSLQLLFF